MRMNVIDASASHFSRMRSGDRHRRESTREERGAPSVGAGYQRDRRC
jgi:hypothetical protein